MHVTSEEGDFVYKKVPRFQPRSSLGISMVEIDPASDTTVCGVYFVTDPDKVVEITIKFLDVECEFGGLLGVNLLRFKTIIYTQYMLNSSWMAGN